jgi:hypothetical protein
MTADDLDRILSAEDSLEPSAGFATNVLEAVRRQASAPPALRFPWLRFTLGLISCLVMAASGSAILWKLTPALVTLATPLASLDELAPEICWAIGAVVVSLGIASIPRLRAEL